MTSELAGRAATVACLAALVSAGLEAAPDRVRHHLEVELDSASHRLTVRDRLELPPADEPVEFLLNAAFSLDGSSAPVEEAPEAAVADFFSLNSGPSREGVELAAYRISAMPDDGVLTVTYSGTVDFGLSAQKEEYTRGFRETQGIVSDEGVYLAGSGFWYPYFGDDLIEFTMTASVPEGWHLVSSGSGTSRDGEGRASWNSGGPVDEIYLVGGPLELYAEAAGAVEAQVYLRSRDEALAATYLEATARYIEMYRALLGPYPYDKFALVENFWETGYGMPSFTLLGPTVIRFPFILTSSYPHEILHNWWGNSVFVDFSGGNWSEGLTAYLADHLIQEQRGTGGNYRRAALQKYRSYVQSGEDFPLTEFRSRHSAATEAVGYGKTLMVFHMLRRRVGDEAFSDGLARFYRRHRGTRAAFSDLEAVFEEAGETVLDRFFSEWVERTGAPRLELEVDGVEHRGDRGFVVSGRLSQAQDGEPYELKVPAVVVTAQGSVPVEIRVADGESRFELEVETQPLALAVDPGFDLFRLLDPLEIPPSIGQIFGEPEILAILPGAAPPTTRAAYRALLEGWRSDSHAVEIVEDSELAELPPARSVWIAGRENRFAALFDDAEQGATSSSGDAVELAGQALSLAENSVVVVQRHPRAAEKAVGWLTVAPDGAFSGFGRKLPHYGKYSYLGFEGDEPTNVVKGQWAAIESPLVADLRPASERGAPLPPVEAPPEKALAELPPAFSQGRLAQHVAALADPALEGRVPGSEGIARAAEYVAAAFAAAGLEPAGDEGFFQTVVIDSGPEGTPVETVNVLGVLPGARPEWRDQSIVVSAHYDHLGRGWPDVHRGDEGAVHPGADDNASGVAVLLELARNLAAGTVPARPVLFAAFTGEEAGRAGSKRYVASLRPEELGGVRAVVNLDTVGRLFDGKVSILGAGTADEWPHIFRGASYVTGVESAIVTGASEASDQMSFIEKGVPGVQLFTGAHDDYHRPADTFEKVDAAGLVEVATLAREAVVYLAGREAPLSATIGDSAAAADGGTGQAESPSRRRVRIGTVPDFAFAGPGVRIDSVASGSPGERAGLRAGDVILKIGGREIADLAAYSAVLKGLEVGQSVKVELRRGDEDFSVLVVVEAR